MVRLSKLLLLVASVAAAPVAAVAQSWPATVVAAAPRIADQARPTFVVAREGSATRQVKRTARPLHLTPRTLRLTASEPDEVPEVAVPAKDEWSDDQGLSVRGARLAYKQRF